MTYLTSLDLIIAFGPVCFSIRPITSLLLYTVKIKMFRLIFKKVCVGRLYRLGRNLKLFFYFKFPCAQFASQRREVVIQK